MEEEAVVAGGVVRGADEERPRPRPRQPLDRLLFGDLGVEVLERLVLIRRVVHRLQKFPERQTGLRSARIGHPQPEGRSYLAVDTPPCLIPSVVEIVMQ